MSTVEPCWFTLCCMRLAHGVSLCTEQVLECSAVVRVVAVKLTIIGHSCGVTEAA